MTGGVEGGDSKQMLAGFVNRVKTIADQIKELQADITDECKDARDAGFDSTKIREVVRWLQKIDKHGREKVDEAETIFDLYRSVVDTGGKRSEEHKSELQSLMRISYAVFCLTKNKTRQPIKRQKKKQRIATYN